MPIDEDHLSRVAAQVAFLIVKMGAHTDFFLGT